MADPLLRKRAMNSVLRNSLLPIIVFAILTIVFTMSIDEGWKNLVAGLPANMVTAIITIVVLNFVLDYRRETSRELRLRVGLAPLRRPLRSTLRMWIAIANKGVVPGHTLDKLIECLGSENFFDRIKWADLNLPLSQGDTKQARERIIPILTNFADRCNVVLLRTMDDNSDEAVEALTYFVDDPMLVTHVTLYVASMSGNSPYVACSQVTKVQFEEYFACLIKLLGIYNDSAEESKKINGENIARLESMY